MSHQPFETWIFDIDRIPQEDRRALKEHLKGCPQCQTVARKWQMVHREMRMLPEVRPDPGFTQRWQTSLVERRAREQRKQAWRAFLWFLGGAMVILVSLAVYAVAVSSPAEWLAVMIRYASSTLQILNGGVNLLRLWVNSTPLALNIALWIYGTVTLCLLCLAWVFALWRTQIIGVFNK